MRLRVSIAWRLTWNVYLEFCDRQKDEIYYDAEHRFSTNKARLSWTKNSSNVGQWFREWQESNQRNNLKQALTLTKPLMV
jgi:P2-related tail formation protein